MGEFMTVTPFDAGVQIGVLGWFGIILLYLLIAGFAYYLYCVTQEKIAKKLKVGSTWMAYVPFARNVERMKIAKMPMWKLMFVGGPFTLIFVGVILWAVGLILGTMNVALAIVVVSILSVVYLIFYFIETYKYNRHITDAFGYERALAFLWTVGLLVPVFGYIGYVFTYHIAFSKRVQANGGRAEAPVYEHAPVAPAAPVAGSFNYSSVGASNVSGLEGVSGMYQGAQFKMNANDEFMIGRDGTLADIVISANSEKVSRRHCSVKFLASFNCYEVTDYSLNGTFYGNSRTRLSKDTPTQLPKGTVLVIGDKNNQFKLL